jgi:hypothetical protein
MKNHIQQNQLISRTRRNITLMLNDKAGFLVGLSNWLGMNAVNGNKFGRLKGREFKNVL